MKHVFARLWSEQEGVLVSSELVIFSTAVVIGMLVGLQTVRDAVVQDLGDFANAIGNINQSYSFAGVTGHHSSTAGSMLVDRADDCDTPAPANSAEPMCIDVCDPAATPES